jgi:ApeA N-terminal domain 1
VSELEQSWRQEGRFWLPGSDTKTAGWIEYAPDRGIAVHLLESPLAATPMDSFSLDALHGESLDGGPWSLFDGELVTPRPITPSNAGTADLVFETLIRGGHIADLQGVTGQMAHVAVHGLRELLRGGGFGESLLAVTADRECHDQLVIEMPWGSLQLIVAGTQTRWSRDETRIAVGAHAQMSFSEALSLPAVDALVEPLRDLVIFARTSPSHVTGLRLLRPGSEGRTHEYRVIRRPESDPRDARTSGPPLLLNPATVPDINELIRGWFELREKLGPVWRLFFATTVAPGLTSEARLLNLSSFAEGYHRTLHDEPPLSDVDAAASVQAMLAALDDDQHRETFCYALAYANSQSQRARIRWLARRAATVLAEWGLDVARVTSEVADTRNWLTHWGERGPHACEGDELSRLIGQLYFVLATNVLLDLGLDEANVAAQLAPRMRLIGWS